MPCPIYLYGEWVLQFCPKCGGVMVPVKKDGKDILRCTKCGFEKEMDKKDKKSYEVKEARSKSERVLTTSIVSEKSGRKRDEDEWEQEREEYYKEVGLELLRDELEGSEENEED
ncbi:MAG: zf-TFIIB domain-containing protein [Candidatus Aramenus sulfurataquae]|jgi:DNA-directed RNA polymerase subunit M|uniref:DNA-directed RNA polymerase subunit M n=3 Tax=Candidatus Aramenus sulfurataquae TaxID=1326980 RepID=A0A0F2LQ53_9CREN|nr:DNA-directed RNA polymerase subunit M [Candidatus Aramenus sp.]MCL7343111.1 DNA-directed RNA polymerase subunit M [Candidatus Aramenus sulfurataquae]